MSTQRDVSTFSDISKSKTEADGSFKRKPSSFRNFIQNGGEFEPEKGESFLSQLAMFLSPLLVKSQLLPSRGARMDMYRVIAVSCWLLTS